MFFNDNSKTERIHFRVTSREKEKLQQLAKSEGLTLTKFIFKCVDYYLKNTYK